MNGELIYRDKNGDKQILEFEKGDPRWEKGDTIPLSVILQAADLDMDEPVDADERDPLRKTGGGVFVTIIADNVRNWFFPPCEKYCNP